MTVNDPCTACGFSPSRRTQRVACLSLDCSFPSQNEIGANAKGTAGYKYRRTKVRIRKALIMASHGQNGLAAEGARRITLTRFYAKRKRLYDRANLVGGGKPLVDLLVECGILKNDNAVWFEGVFHQLPSPTGKDMTQIEIEDFLEEEELADDLDDPDSVEFERILRQLPVDSHLPFDMRYDDAPKTGYAYSESHDRVLLAVKPLTPRQARIRLAERAMAAGMIGVGEIYETAKYFCLRVRYRAGEIK